MSWEDVKAILKTIAAVYPNSYRHLTKETANHTVDVWHKFLQDYDKNIIEKVVNEYIRTDTTGFPPVIGKLIEAADKRAKSSFDIDEFFNKAVEKTWKY